MNKLDLGLPIPFKPINSDYQKVIELAKKEERPVSAMLRILLHEAVLAREGLVQVKVIGKFNNQTTVEQLEAMQGGVE